MTYWTEARLPIEFAPVAQLLRAQFDMHEMTAEETTDEIVSNSLYGRIGARRDGETTLLFVESNAEQMLYALQADVAGHLLEVLPDLQFDWSLRLVEGSHPPNFHLARVAGARPAGSGFQRIRLELPDASVFSGENMHFRLLLPQTLGKPGWPVAGDRGQTIWPKGREALHMPVYTTRILGDGWLEFDVFKHDGGKATKWALGAETGEEVGLLGPGGGGLPRAKKILFAGDEAALPAIERMLEDPRCPSQVQVVIKSSVRDYPLSRKAERTGDLPGAVIAALSPDQFLWAGGHRSDMQALRNHVKANGRRKGMMHIVNYWL